MKPAKPVMKQTPHGVKEVTFAEDQPQYQPLPGLMFCDGTLVTRWELSWKERFKVLLSGSIFLHVLTFNKPLQPVFLDVDEPQLAEEG